MSSDISRKNEARLTATARAEGVSVDAYLERLMDEREEFAAIIEMATARMTAIPAAEARGKIERGFLESERGEVVDGETYCSELLGELDELEQKRRAG